MGLHYAYSPQEARLELALDGDLDLTLTPRLMEAIKFIDARLRSCIIDTSEVQREFDSGIALMSLLIDRLARYEINTELRGPRWGRQASALSQVL